MVWAAVFLLCNAQQCFTSGSPVFSTKEVCEYSAEEYGLPVMGRTYPNHYIVAWKCVPFGKEA
jgi:hypothetical protein